MEGMMQNRIINSAARIKNNNHGGSKYGKNRTITDTGNKNRTIRVSDRQLRITTSEEQPAGSIPIFLLTQLDLSQL